MRNKSHVFALLAIILNIAALIGFYLYLTKKVADKRKLGESYSSYYFITNQWLLNKIIGKNITDFFKNNDYGKIAIYGAGTMAELLYKDLKNSDIKIEYFIDKKADELGTAFGGIKCINIKEIGDEPEVDAIIVTPVAYMSEIRKSLEYVTADVLSIEDAVYGV